jgi:hypothetical protein
MSKLPPYEQWDEQWSEGLPLPDADAAWADMNKKLDADDRRRRFAFLPLLSCAGWILLGVAVLGAGTWLLWPRHNAPDRTQAVATSKASKTPATGTSMKTGVPAAASVTEGPSTGSPATKDHANGSPAQTSHSIASSTETNQPVAAATGTDGSSVKTNRNSKSATTTNGTGETPLLHSTKSPVSAGYADRTKTSSAGKLRLVTGGSTPVLRKQQAGAITTGAGRKSKATSGTNAFVKTTAHGTNVVSASSSNITSPNSKDRRSTVTAPHPDKAITVATNNTASSQDPSKSTPTTNGQTAAPVTDRSSTMRPATTEPPATATTATGNPLHPVDSNDMQVAPPLTAVTPTAAPDSNTTAAAKPDSGRLAAISTPKKKGIQGWTFSAGLSIHQAIPVSGQQAWAKSYGGNSNPFSEHLPGLWFRAQKGRWGLQAEARFHAPQLLPEFVFAQKTRWDTAGHSVVTERQSLRKLWYHQFAGTVNFNITSRWSVGAGAQWSLLHRAYAERSFIRSDFAGNVSAVTTEARPISGFRDSFLYKTQWQLLLQTDYNWRRWTLGIRYRFDTEPYIRFTKPDGTVVEKRNDALEAILRLRLWQKMGR